MWGTRIWTIGFVVAWIGLGITVSTPFSSQEVHAQDREGSEKWTHAYIEALRGAPAACEACQREAQNLDSANRWYIRTYEEASRSANLTLFDRPDLLRSLRAEMATLDQEIETKRVMLNALVADFEDRAGRIRNVLELDDSNIEGRAYDAQGLYPDIGLYFVDLVLNGGRVISRGRNLNRAYDADLVRSASTLSDYNFVVQLRLQIIELNAEVATLRAQRAEYGTLVPDEQRVRGLEEAFRDRLTALDALERCEANSCSDADQLAAFDERHNPTPVDAAALEAEAAQLLEEAKAEEAALADEEQALKEETEGADGLGLPEDAGDFVAPPPEGSPEEGVASEDLLDPGAGDEGLVEEEQAAAEVEDLSPDETLNGMGLPEVLDLDATPPAAPLPLPEPGFAPPEIIVPDLAGNLPEGMTMADIERIAAEQAANPSDPCMLVEVETICQRFERLDREACLQLVGAYKTYCEANLAFIRPDPARLDACLARCDLSLRFMRTADWLRAHALSTAVRSSSQAGAARENRKAQISVRLTQIVRDLSQLEAAAAARLVYFYQHDETQEIFEHYGEYFEPTPPLTYVGFAPGQPSQTEWDRGQALNIEFDRLTEELKHMEDQAAGADDWLQDARAFWNTFDNRGNMSCDQNGYEAEYGRCQADCRGEPASPLSTCSSGYLNSEVNWWFMDYMYTPGYPRP